MSPSEFQNPKLMHLSRLLLRTGAACRSHGLIRVSTSAAKVHASGISCYPKIACTSACDGLAGVVIVEQKNIIVTARGVCQSRHQAKQPLGNHQGPDCEH